MKATKIDHDANWRHVGGMTAPQVQSQPPLQAIIIPVTPFEQNCSLIWCTQTMRGAFVDAGGDIDKLMAVAHAHHVSIEKLLVTHGHLDHCGMTGILARQLKVPIEGPHLDDKFWIDQHGPSAAEYNMPGESFTPDRWLEDGDTVTVGAASFAVVHCPGHTPGHVVFVHEAMQVAFVGDVLFQGSIGRTDFPRGNHADLIASITQKLWPFGNDVRFVPGHGPMSSFGQERLSNSYVADHVLAGG
jgi:hydroxyacylglutathione hydrolase